MQPYEPHAGAATVRNLIAGNVQAFPSGEAVTRGTVALPVPPLTLAKSWNLADQNPAEAPVQYVAGGLVQAGMLTLISGPAKSRKSYLLADLAVAIAGGGAWLGNACPRPSRVLLVDLELNPHYLFKRIETVAGASGEAGKRAVPNLTVLPWRHASIQPGANARRILDAVAKEAEDTKADVVLIDSIYMLLDGDESDPQAVGELLRLLVRLCEKYAVVFTHHFAKGSAASQKSKSAIDRASGSSYWSRFADVLIPLTAPPLEDGNDRVLLDVEPSIRHHAPQPPKMIEWLEGPRFQVLTDAQREAATPVTVAKTATEGRQQREGQGRAPEVLSVLVEKFDGAVKLSDLRKHCNTTKTAVGGTFTRAVERLVKEGSVRETNNNGVMGLEVVLRQDELPTESATPPMEPCPEEEIPWGPPTVRIPPDPVEVAAWIALGAEKWKVPMPAHCWAHYPHFNGESRCDDNEFWVGQPEEGRWGNRDYLTTQH
ncbi:MAG: hypothetical protein EBR81_07950 [Proteobacteria bacterium]|nr:hypothetical protein [Pseudomonadota bacterium]